LNLALDLKEHGIPIWGTDPDSIDLAEDREKFNAILDELKVSRPRSGMAFDTETAFQVARDMGYPVLVRPSYVLGGRAMAVCYDKSDLARYMTEAVKVSPKHPILIDEFLENAVEVDVDAIADTERVVIGGIMQHVEEAGIHSGDSCCTLPTHSISAKLLKEIRESTIHLAKRLRVVGLMNVQYAIKDEKLFVLEVNPRASRTIPFVSKATGVPLAKLGARLMAGAKLKELGFTEEPKLRGFHVKAPIFPFDRFLVDPLLGPEMKSTGEVMGTANDLGAAFAKTQINMKARLPLSGCAFVSVNDQDKSRFIALAKELGNLEFSLVATKGTTKLLRQSGLPVESVNKVNEGHPHIVDAIREGKIALLINTPLGKASHQDEAAIRIAAVKHRIPYVTTLSGADAVIDAIRSLRQGALTVNAITEYYLNEPLAKKKH
jgi:carbamoyl-phosphate synthase large subunit